MHAKRATSISNISIGSCCKGLLKTAGGFVWRYEGDPFDLYDLAKKPRRLNKDNYKQIIRYSLSDECIDTYSNVICEELSKYNKYKILDSCRRKILSCYNSIWRFEGDDDDIIDVTQTIEARRDKHYAGKRIFQFTLDGDYIESFNTIARAAAITGYNASNISACCRRVTKTCGRSFFFYEKDVTEAFINHAMEDLVRDTKSVSQFDKQGNFIKEYRCAEDAAAEIGVTGTAVYYNCQMKTLLTKGFIFLFSGDNLERHIEEKLHAINKE